MQRPFALLVVSILVAVASCESRSAEVPSPPFEEVFETVEVIVPG
ncbi:MAG: hypothetical protein OXG71_05715 [Rhodospirillales bacterium]|nr:hypothetical protein [Rhodospirillales bacterium]